MQTGCNEPTDKRQTLLATLITSAALLALITFAGYCISHH